ncbi:MAG: hypothetical protein ACKOSO_08945, partial [Actinomycetota bacterium]
MWGTLAVNYAVKTRVVELGPGPVDARLDGVGDGEGAPHRDGGGRRDARLAADERQAAALALADATPRARGA